MPLTKSKTKDAFKSNLKAELKAGKPKDQALAIAFRVQREAKADGGGVGSPPFRSEARGLERSGYIPGSTAGRADKVPTAVKTNSYVIPADIVSGIGQGNSNAGAHALYRMFGMGPYGSSAVRPPSMKSKPRKMFADGGMTDDEHPITEIKISDGEFSVPPEKVLEIGNGDMEHGHAVLDAFVKHMRKKTIKSLKSLPGPKNG